MNFKSSYDFYSEAYINKKAPHFCEAFVGVRGFEPRTLCL